MPVITSQYPRSILAREVRNWIRSGDLPAGDRLPSSVDLAKRFGVSRPTVRAAMELLVNEGLVERNKIKSLVVAQPQKRQNKSVLVDTVLVVTLFPDDPSKAGPSGWEIATEGGIIAELHDRGLSGLTMRADNLTDERIATMIDSPPKAVLFRADPDCDSPLGDLVSACKQAGIPMATYGSSTAWDPIDRVCSDHSAGCYELTNYLIQKGCRRILRAWIMNPHTTGVPAWVEARNAGYELAISQAGLACLPPIMGHSLPETKIALNPAYFNELSTRMLAGYLAPHLCVPDPVDGILVVSDGGVFAVAQACRILGKEPNKDVLLAGYDNYWQQAPERATESVVPVATMDKRNWELGRATVQLLMDRLDGKLPPEPQLRSIKPKLIVTNGYDFGPDRTAMRSV